MKSALTCVVITLSCSVCASEALEIYPDLTDDWPPPPKRPRLGSPEDAPSTIDGGGRRPWGKFHFTNWRNYKKKEPTFELPQQLQKIQELLDQNENQLKTEDVLPLFYNSRVFDNAYGEYQDMETSRDLPPLYFNRKELDDVRPYPHEDDFIFGEESGGEESLEENQPRPGQHHHAEFVEQASEKVEGESTQKMAEILANAKFVDDPSQFAYPPSDVRFFRNGDNLDEPSSKSHFEKPAEGDIRVSTRIDETLLGQKSLGSTEQQVAVVALKPQVALNESTGVYIIAVIAGIGAAVGVGLIAVGIGWYNLQKHVKSASDVEYPAYGVTGPNKDTSPSGDRRLAQSAQMYHYQHQKQQIIAMESRATTGERHGSVSEAESDEENEEGDYTVYECPGLAPTGEMEVKNPLFQDDPTPAQTPPVKSTKDEKK